MILTIGFCFISCKAQTDLTVFPKEALTDTFVTLEDKELSLKDILDRYKGKTILIDVWASWCRDCIIGLPNLKALQADNDDVVYLFISMDKTKDKWKNAIKTHDIKGEHYFMPKGWKSAFSKAVDLDWVPRYIVVDAEGKIALFRAIKADDPNIKTHLY